MKKNTIKKIYQLKLPHKPKDGLTLEYIQIRDKAYVYPRIPGRIARLNMEKIDSYGGEF